MGCVLHLYRYPCTLPRLERTCFTHIAVSTLEGQVVFIRLPDARLMVSLIAIALITSSYGY